MVTRRVGLAVAVGLVILGTVVALLASGIRHRAEEAHIAAVRRVVDVDPADLSAACDQLVMLAPSMASDPNWHNAGRRILHPDPRDPAVPKSIQGLGPVSISVYTASGEVVLEFGGGFGHYGVLRGGQPPQGTTVFALGSRLWLYSEIPAVSREASESLRRAGRIRD